MGVSLLYTGDIAKARVHLEQAIALYNAAEHRPLATRFGQDIRVVVLCYRSLALWVLGYPEAAIADTDQSDQRCARNRPSGHFDVCADPRCFDPYLLRKLRGSKRAADETRRFGGRKRRFVWKGCGMHHPRLRILP